MKLKIIFALLLSFSGLAWAGETGEFTLKGSTMTIKQIPNHIKENTIILSDGTKATYYYCSAGYHSRYAPHVRPLKKGLICEKDSAIQINELSDSEKLDKIIKMLELPKCVEAWRTNEHWVELPVGKDACIARRQE